MFWRMDKVRIFVNEKEIIYKDWWMSIDSNGEIILNFSDFNEKKYKRLYKECEIEPINKRKENILYDKKKKNYQNIVSAEEVGKKYLLVTFFSSEKKYLMKCENVELYKSSSALSGKIYGYFKNIAKERLENAKGESIVIDKYVVSQFEKIVPYEGTALNAYITRKLQDGESVREFIYPFGINETQMEAVKNAFLSQISIIEGPPGTGKTQTILNIIANIIVNGKTCAVVSNNNSAVENVYEKLEKKGLDFLIAKLGKSYNKDVFFNSINYDKPRESGNLITLEEVRQSIEKLERCLHVRNVLAKTNSEIQEIETEKKYLKQWNDEHPEVKMDYIEKYKLDCIKTVDLMTYLMYLPERALTFKNKWDLLLRYKVFKSKFLNNIEDRESFIFSLQMTYYHKILIEKNKEKEKLEKVLMDFNFDEELKKLQNNSLRYLYQYLNLQMPSEKPDFTVKNYKNNFSEFMKYFPVIGSSTYSLVDSIAKGYLLDYVIIDEASQQDLVPGILCLGCAKNVIVVGDRKQLSHIAIPSSIPAPESLYDCTEHSLLDSVSEIFENKIPRTLLKEHYRCHPKIIQFCNKQFYDNQLIPMTKDNGEDVLSLVTTAAGNHMRNYQNQREIESVLKATDDCGFLNTEQNGESVGFIAPYNAQINLAHKMMPESVTKNTIHKFQGRECDKIIFSTVLDKKKVSQRMIDFVDNAELVNVAVSRAKNKFTLVTGKDVFKKNNKYIAALIRYIQYYASKEELYDSPVVSAFDLLYSEYDKSLERLKKRLNSKDSKYKSEQLMATVLREILGLADYELFLFHEQIYLKQLISIDSGIFSEHEIKFINNRASCDFVIYYRVGKQPFAVIEVDGGCHDNEEQKRRDALKDSILHKAGIPLCRVKTTDGNVTDKVTGFLLAHMRSDV